jgi:hypothetical protein
VRKHKEQRAVQRTTFGVPWNEVATRAVKRVWESTQNGYGRNRDTAFPKVLLLEALIDL